MSKSITQRLLCMLLCLTMLVGMIPLQVFASMPQTSQSTSTNSQNSESLPLNAARDRMDAILDKYLGTTQMAELDVAAAVASMKDAALVGAWEDSSELVEQIKALTDAEFYMLALHDSMETFGYFYSELERLFAPVIDRYAATTLTLLDGTLTVTDSIGNGTLSGTTVTVKAVGSIVSKKTNTITIANESGNKATLSFDYSAASANAFTIAGTTAASSGTYSTVLEPSATLVITLQSKSGLSDRTATLTMSNFSLTTAAEASDVTFSYDEAYGSVTAGGTAVGSGDVLNVSLADGVALTASTTNGGRFLGWVDASSHAVLSTAASYTLYPSSNVTVQAVFAGANSAPWFGVGAKTQSSVSSGLLGMTKLYYYTVSVAHMFSDLNAAASYAGQSSKSVVLLNDGTLPSGNYTIPANVTLVIPFSSDNRFYTTQVENTSAESYTTPTAYRTLTLADGAKITVNGAISVPAKQTHAQGAKFGGGGVPTGAAAFIRMQGSSNITVNNGGALYAYGFITGSGSVVANSGATVYECFQLMDFRGGTQSTGMENGVFPMSQYYIQNIEVPMTLYAGASEYSYTTIYMSSADFGSSVKFISSSEAMFNLSSGYVVKEYDGSTDRLIVRSYGNISVSPISMKVGTSSIDSADYDLPISSALTVDAVSGAITIGQDVAFLPGSQIKIGEGVTCTLGQGISVYVYDAQVWDTFAFAASKDYKFIPASYAPSRTYTRTDADIVDAKVIINGTVDASAGYLYSTVGGADIYSEGNGVIISKPGTQTVTYQYKQTAAAYSQIALVAGVLKNADGTTVSMTSPSGTYSYADGKWTVACEHVYTSAQTKAPTCTEAGVTTYSCPCGSSYTESIPALGHTAGAGATCTTAQTCTVCGAELAAALGHSYTLTESKAPTCTETGSNSYTCTCGDSYTESVPALGHTAGAGATCTTAQTCTVCGAELAAALGHSYTESITTPAGCESEGTKTYTCTCGDSYTESIPAVGHSLTTTVVEAGAHTLGTTTVTCSGCDYEQITYTDATDGLIIYVDPAAQNSGNGTEQSPFNSYAAAFEYADGQFDATVILLGTVSFTESFNEPEHAGAYVITGGGISFADGVHYSADKLTFRDIALTADTSATIVATEIVIESGVTGNGGVSLSAGDITVRSGNFKDVTGTRIVIDGGIIAGTVKTTDTLKVTNGFDYKNSFTLEGAGFFGVDGSVIYVYSAYVKVGS